MYVSWRRQALQLVVQVLQFNYVTSSSLLPLNVLIKCFISTLLGHGSTQKRQDRVERGTRWRAPLFLALRGSMGIAASLCWFL